MKIHFWRVCFLCRKCLKNKGHDLLWYRHLGKLVAGSLLPNCRSNVGGAPSGGRQSHPVF